jgi:hypothetical protein
MYYVFIFLYVNTCFNFAVQAFCWSYIGRVINLGASFFCIWSLNHNILRIIKDALCGE